MKRVIFAMTLLLMLCSIIKGIRIHENGFAACQADAVFVGGTIRHGNRDS